MNSEHILEILEMLKGFTMLAANSGFGHACAVLNDGDGECWGADYSSQASNGNTQTGIGNNKFMVKYPDAWVIRICLFLLLIIAFYGMGLLLHGLTLDIGASSLFFLPHFTSLEV